MKSKNRQTHRRLVLTGSYPRSDAANNIEPGHIFNFSFKTFYYSPTTNFPMEPRPVAAGKLYPSHENLASIGTSALGLIEGMMNIKTYLPTIERRVSRESANLHHQAIFQHDSASCHKAKMITQYFQKMKMEVLEWPGNLPDLNSIKNLLFIAKNCLRKQDCTTKMKLIQSVKHI